MTKITISDESSDPVEVVITGPSEKVGKVFDAVQEVLRGMEEGHDEDRYQIDPSGGNPFKGTLEGVYQISMGNSRIHYKDDPVFEPLRTNPDIPRNL